ncbi:MAG: metallophosphoesterase, partial [Frankiales bacterium]|nr:metallophosphoesterase [Frankiales bacterium]
MCGMRPLVAVPAAVTAFAAAGISYSLWEAGSFRLRRIDVPCLLPGAAALRVLHFTDAHMTPEQNRKQDFIRELDALEPDLVVQTGDNLAHLEAVPSVLDSYAPLLQRPGVFVFGSNDYYAPKPKNPVNYLRKNSGKRVLGIPLPWRELRDGFTSAGWVDLTNTRASLTIKGAQLAFAGVDDPHIKRDRHEAGLAPLADLTIGVMHSPEPRVLNAMAADGYDLLLAGHTHGGQLCIPGFGALVTNCGLPTAMAKGLHRWPRPGVTPAWLHVSAGLGCSPYTPVRFACPPEATLLTLRP